MTLCRMMKFLKWEDVQQSRQTGKVVCVYTDTDKNQDNASNLKLARQNFSGNHWFFIFLHERVQSKDRRRKQ